MYCLDIVEQPIHFPLPIGTICFKETIECIRELLDIIGEYARQYDIPIIDMRGEKPVQQLHL
jgi:hypothetical protein